MALFIVSCDFWEMSRPARDQILIIPDSQQGTNTVYCGYPLTLWCTTPNEYMAHNLDLYFRMQTSEGEVITGDHGALELPVFPLRHYDYYFEEGSEIEAIICVEEPSCMAITTFLFGTQDSVMHTIKTVVEDTLIITVATVEECRIIPNASVILPSCL